ncbi:MAG: PAS domain-containing protein, partial [Comamonadaceae bacterium]
MIAPTFRRIAAYVYGVAALFLLAVAVLAWGMVQQNLERAMAETESQAVRFVSGAEAALNRSLLGIDILLASLDQLLPAAGDDSVDIPPAANDRLWAKPLLERAVHQNLLVRYVALLDPAGRVLGSSDARGDRLRVVLPKGFLAEVLAEPMATLTISTPAVSFSSSQKVLYFARLLQTSDGGNAVAVAEVQSSLLTGILTQGADIRGLEVTLERDHGPMLASVPPREELTGRTLMPQLSEQSSGTGAVRMAGRLSGKPSVVALRPTLHRNLLIVAGIPLDAALEEWQEQRSLIFGSAGLFAFMILAVAVFTHLQLHRQWRSRMALLRSKATLDEALESMLDGVVLLDRKDRVVAWNRRFVELFPWNERWMRPLRPFQEVLDATSRHVRLDEAENREDWLQTHLAAHRAAAGEQELKLRDGQVIRGTKSRTPDGGMVCVYQDVTEKIRHTTDILESRAELQATLDALPDLLLEVG